jgi:hypothetical protein
LLSNIPRTREIADAGRAEILKGHLASHRADLVMEQVLKLGGAKRVKHRANFGMGSNIAVFIDVFSIFLNYCWWLSESEYQIRVTFSFTISGRAKHFA